MRLLFASLLAASLLSACNNERKDEPAAVDDAANDPAVAEAQPTEPVSIIRPDIEEAVLIPLEPLKLTIAFGEGTDLNEAAIASLQALIVTRQFSEGGAITIGGHSDAGGQDAVNLRVSQARADAVKEWLVNNGADEARITTIAFGEQNPIAPNALPDGAPNEEGRMANRRTEIAIAVPEGTMIAAEPKPAGVPEPQTD